MDLTQNEEQITVKGIIQGLYELTQAQNITTDGELISVADLQDLFYQQIDLLAATLGMELED